MAADRALGYRDLGILTAGTRSTEVRATSEPELPAKCGPIGCRDDRDPNMRILPDTEERVVYERGDKIAERDTEECV